jgi:hypothetical protein
MVQSALAIRHGAALAVLEPARVDTFVRGVRVQIERTSETAEEGNGGPHRES